jgi:hypothetical protein
LLDARSGVEEDLGNGNTGFADHGIEQEHATVCGKNGRVAELVDRHFDGAANRVGKRLSTHSVATGKRLKYTLSNSLRQQSRRSPPVPSARCWPSALAVLQITDHVQTNIWLEETLLGARVHLDGLLLYIEGMGYAPSS